MVQFRCSGGAELVQWGYNVGAFLTRFASSWGGGGRSVRADTTLNRHKVAIITRDKTSVLNNSGSKFHQFRLK